MECDSYKILFILGPSGCGKSSLGSWIAEDLGFLHLEIDQWPKGNGIDLASLRPQWELFLEHGSAGPLAEVIRLRVANAGRAGAVLTFPGRLVIPVPRIAAAMDVGIVVVVLYGTGAECIDAFLTREAAIGRGIGIDHWIANNHDTYAELSCPEYASCRVVAFDNGRHQPRAALVKEIRRRLIRSSRRHL
jgi:hypothetical protein